jgi:hypothetical protein
MNRDAQASLGTIDQFLEKVGEEEKAALGSDGSKATTEPGSQGGETEHPVKNVDDRTTQPADTGDRFAENSSDAKSDDTGQGAPAVDNTSEAKAKVGSAKQAGNDEGTAADDQLQIGTNVQATGDDPSNETSSTKSTKEDDGYEGASSHPARTDNDEIDGHKYAELSLEKLAELMQDAGNDLCATLAVSAPQVKQAEGNCPGCKCPKSECDCGMYGKSKEGGGSKCAADNAALAQQAGWDLAGILTGDMDKEAADRMVHETVVSIIKQASEDADNVIEYLTHYTRTKRAMEDDAMAGQAEAGGEAPPEAGGEMGGDPGAVPGAGAGGGAEDMAAALGGGAPPPEGEPDPEAVLALLAQLGLPPEEVLAAMQQEGAGGLEGGMGGMADAGGPPPPGAEGPPPGMDVAASDQGGQPTFQQKNAAIRGYLTELLTRSRAKEAQAQAAQAQTQA